MTRPDTPLTRSIGLSGVFRWLVAAAAVIASAPPSPRVASPWRLRAWYSSSWRWHSATEPGEFVSPPAATIERQEPA